MSIFNWFKWKYRRGSAPVARDRLKVLLEHEGRRRVKSDLLGQLRGEIVAVICRHVTVEPENVQVKMNRGATVSTLAIDIEIPA
jgi:cell division topological specificity factor